MSSAQPAELPRVAAVLVVHDGAEWLSSVLATLGKVRYPALDLVVVDNASRDGSAEILARRIPPDRIITARRNLGFARAVASTLSHPVVAAADYLLLLHDDLVLAPDAVGHLVAELERDESLGIVGPKLREWSEELLLAEVGRTIDRYGRTEFRVERGELDQGQHDRTDDVLYVNTAGMLLRRELFRELGGFDIRFPAFRDDLDLCWRAWLFGSRVAVVPEAVGYHIAARTRAGRRFGGSEAYGARYLEERHAIAAVLKNYGALRLAWVVPIMVALAIAKTIAFLAIRRFGEAGSVVRAYGWNAAQLPRTMRRRRVVQRRRRRADSEITRLFAPGLPRARVYTEAFGAWLAGGSTRALIDDETLAAEQSDRLANSALLRVMRDRPALVTGLGLLACYLIGLYGLLGRGQILGGEIGAWPERAREFLGAYAAPFVGDPLGVHGFSSPIQAVLGIVSVLGLGSAWLAQRLVVFGLLPLGWLLALRAGRLITSRAGPRALGATLYVLSPVVMGALGQGRFGALVVAALLPGLVLVAVRAADPRLSAATTWRATALLALGLAVAVAAAPTLAPMLVVGWAAAVATSLAVRRRESRLATGRILLAGALAVLILSPWLLTLATGGSLGATNRLGADAAHLPLWRAITVVPEVLPGLGGLSGILVALASAAVVGASILVGLRRRPDVVAVLVALGGMSALAAWGADRLRVSWLWAPGLLLPTALALAGLAVLAARSLAGGLREYEFGARQLSVVVAATVMAVGLGSGVVRLTAGPWDGLARDPEIVPAFVGSEAPVVGPYRILLLSDRGDDVAWTVTDAGGPSMVTYGAPGSTELLEAVGEAVGGVAGGGDPRAGGTLGAVNVRYVVVVANGTSPQLAGALADQPALEPLPATAGRVYRVRSWVPRAVVLPNAAAERLLATGDAGNTRALEERGLVRTDRASYRRTGSDGGVLLLSEASSDRWSARIDGTELERIELDDTAVNAPLNAWRAPVGASVGVDATGALGHRVVVGLQALVVALVLSLALRPPRFTQRQQERRRAASLPRELEDREPEVTA